MERKADPIEHQSENPLDERIEKLKRLFPEAVNEDGIDVDALVNLLGKREARRERYNFTWAGKQDAVLLGQARSQAALKPVPEESLNWDHTGHLFIEGDNLEVMKLLHKSYFRRVKMIYIDPPYNTGKDFVYPDNYAQPLDHYLRLTGQVDEDGKAQTTHLDKNGRRHSNWLSMMYPRLFLARQLLREDGVIFVSIDDNEVHNLRMLMNQIFGEENFVSQIVVKSNPGGRDYGGIARIHEYVLVYGSSEKSELNAIEAEELPLVDEYGRFSIRELRNRNIRFNSNNRPNLYYPFYVNPLNPDNNDLHQVSIKPNPGWTEVFPLESSGVKTVWRWQRETVLQHINVNVMGKLKRDGTFQIIEKYRKTTKRERSILEDKKFRNEQGTITLKSLLGNRSGFEYPKSHYLIKRLIELGSRASVPSQSTESDIILDFFAGSATTAHAVLEQNREDGGNRKFIMVQLPEPMNHEQFDHIADVGKERIRRVIQRMKSEGDSRPDEDLGFRVFKLDKSPRRQWQKLPADTAAEDYIQQMTLFVTDPLLDGWTAPDVIAEVAVKEAGFSLTYRVEPVQAVTEQTVCQVIDDEKEQHFYICLDEVISLDALKPLELTRDDLFVFRDRAVSDTIIANLALACRIKSI